MKKINAILIIDDDPIGKFLTRRLIEKCDITDNIILAANGLDALKKLSEYAPYENICPELIITEMEMPIMDGLEFIESFKGLTFENKDKVKIIANSSTINDAYKNRLGELNIDFYLHKPLNIETIHEIAHTLETVQILSVLKKEIR
jgi:CheY-like chemotaxis protein